MCAHYFIVRLFPCNPLIHIWLSRRAPQVYRSPSFQPRGIQSHPPSQRIQLSYVAPRPEDPRHPLHLDCWRFSSLLAQTLPHEPYSVLVLPIHSRSSLDIGRPTSRIRPWLAFRLAVDRSILLPLMRSGSRTYKIESVWITESTGISLGYGSPPCIHVRPDPPSNRGFRTFPRVSSTRDTMISGGWSSTIQVSKALKVTVSIRLAGW